MHDIIQRYYRAVDNDNITDLLDLFADDAVYERPGYPAMNGWDALRRFYAEERVISTGSHKIEHVVSSGEDHVVMGTFSGVLRDGSKSEVAFADHFVLRNDRQISFRRTYFYVSAV